MIFGILPTQHATRDHRPNDVSTALRSTRKKQTQERSQNSIIRADTGPANPQTATAKQQSKQPEQRATVLWIANTFSVQWDDLNVDNDHDRESIATLRWKIQISSTEEPIVAYTSQRSCSQNFKEKFTAQSAISIINNGDAKLKNQTAL